MKLLKSRCVSEGNAARDSRIGPVSELEARERFWREVKLPMVGGIVSLRELEERLRWAMFSRRVREMGILPLM